MAKSQLRKNCTTTRPHMRSFETLRAATNAQNAEKIKRLARLLANYDRVVLTSDVDDYEEEFVRHYRRHELKEFQILLLLRKHEEDDSPQRKRTSPSMVYNYWPYFQREAEAKGVPERNCKDTCSALRGRLRLTCSTTRIRINLRAPTQRFCGSWNLLRGTQQNSGVRHESRTPHVGRATTQRVPNQRCRSRSAAYRS